MNLSQSRVTWDEILSEGLSISVDIPVGIFLSWDSGKTCFKSGGIVSQSGPDYISKESRLSS